jgi:hypothetical protein
VQRSCEFIMNFKIDFPKSQSMLNEIICGYFSVWRQVSILRESVNKAQNIQESNNKAVCEGVKCIQETLFYGSVTAISAWFIDTDKQTASLHHVISKLKDEHFSKKLEAWYSKPPETITINRGNSEEPKFWHKSFTEERKVEFQSKKKDILEKYDLFYNSDVKGRVYTLRNKYVAHKDFNKSKLHDVDAYGHQLSDSESVLKLLGEFIFDLNNLFNKSTFLDHPSNFDRACEEFWNALEST